MTRDRKLPIVPSDCVMIEITAQKYNFFLIYQNNFAKKYVFSSKIVKNGRYS